MIKDIGVTIGLVALCLQLSSCFVHAGDWAIAGQAVGKPPLPFQAARVRISLKNTSGRVLQFDSFTQYPWGNVVEAKSPSESHFHRVHHTVCDPGRPNDTSILERYDSFTPLNVGADEELTVVVAMAAEWNRIPKVLFDTHGVCSIRLLQYEPNREVDTPMTSDPIDITVNEPTGDDERIVVELRRDAELVSALLSPLEAPKDDVVVRLKELVRRFPASSYSDYARFAIGRWRVRNVMGLHAVTESDKIAAIELLEDINHEQFAYGDYSLSLLRNILHSMASKRRNEVAARLDAAFPDGKERLEDLAQRITLAEWKKLGPRSPSRSRSEQKSE